MSASRRVGSSGFCCIVSVNDRRSKIGVVASLGTLSAAVLYARRTDP